MTPDWSRATVLSVTEFEVCWEVLGLGETPWQLDPPRAGRSAAERRAVIDGVALSLQQRGLGDDRGPRPQVRLLFDVLARPDQECDIRYRTDTLVAAVAARRGSDAVLAVRQAHEIALLDLPAADAPAVLVGLPGPTVRGPGPEVVVAAGALDAARAHGPDLVPALIRHGVPARDADTLGRLHGSAVVLRGQCGATVRDGSRRRRAPSVVGFHRTTAGGYSHVRRGNSVRIAPADHDDVLGALRGLP